MCVSSGEKHGGHSVTSVKIAAVDVKLAVEGYTKAAQIYAKEAETHAETVNAKLRGEPFFLVSTCVS